MKRRDTRSSPTPGVIEKVAPELMRQLQETPANQPVRAHFTLTTPAGQKVRDAQDTRETVNRIVESASKASSSSPDRVKIQESVQSFSISAQPELVRALVRSDQIAKAYPGRTSEQMVIRPPGPPKLVDLPDLKRDPAKTTKASKASKASKRTQTKASTASTKALTKGSPKAARHTAASETAPGKKAKTATRKAATATRKLAAKKR